MTIKNEAVAVFSHPKSIQVGRGRILWGTSTIPTLEGPYEKKYLFEGWVLPGGERTTDPEVALAWATYIDENYVRKSRK